MITLAAGSAMAGTILLRPRLFVDGGEAGGPGLGTVVALGERTRLLAQAPTPRPVREQRRGQRRDLRLALGDGERRLLAEARVALAAAGSGDHGLAGRLRILHLFPRPTASAHRAHLHRRLHEVGL